MRLKCPHCHSPMRHRTTRALTPLISESYHCCKNDDCGFKVKAMVEMVGYTQQAITPNPAITLTKLERGRKSMAETCEEQV